MSMDDASTNISELRRLGRLRGCCITLVTHVIATKGVSITLLKHDIMENHNGIHQ